MAMKPGQLSLMRQTHKLFLPIASAIHETHFHDHDPLVMSAAYDQFNIILLNCLASAGRGAES